MSIDKRPYRQRVSQRHFTFLVFLQFLRKIAIGLKPRPQSHSSIFDLRPQSETEIVEARKSLKTNWRKRVGVGPTDDRIACHPPVLKTGTITGPHALPFSLNKEMPRKVWGFSPLRTIR